MVGMGEDSWLIIDDDLSHCASDSDAIDSETEAELYSTIHYEQNINSQITSPVKFENIEPNHTSSPAIPWSSQENNICTQKHQQTSNLKEKEISFKRNTSLHEFKHDSNSTKKSKTDFASDNLNSDDSENDSQPLFKHKSGENVKNINLCSTRIKKSPQKRDNTFVLDSSDSDDSNIWKEIDSSEKSDFTINLSKGHVDPFYLTSSDSDSDSPSTSSQAFRKRESVLRNLSMPNIKIGEKLEGEWYINTEDLYRSKKYSHRYHNKSDSLCSNCNRKGHNFKNCPEPKALKCFICGGPHLGYRCPNRICSTCFQYGHDRMRCQMGPNCFSCELCLMRGHTIQNCPDLWRRYHLTTTNSEKIVKGRKVKQVSNVYCWNCGNTGHFGGACQTSLSRNSVNTWPCVISYEDPREMFRTKRQFQKKNLADWRNGHNFSSNEGSVQAEKKMQKNKKKSAKRRQKQKEKVLSEKERNKKAKRCEKTIRKTEKKIETIVREKNFPRSPKQILQQQCDETPRSLEILQKRSLRKQRLKLNRLLNRHKKLIDGTLNEFR